MKLKSRKILLIVMLAATLLCGILIPKININGDLTKYLPADSEMKEGLDSLRRFFPELDTNSPTVKVMTRGTFDTDSLAAVLTKEEGIVMMMSKRQKDSLCLFELTASKDVKLTELAARIKAEHPECIAAETNANSNMPDNMILILAIAGLLIFVILFVMCSSFMEALLFIVTIALAVVMNMGTNAFLPSVSMMTNTIVAILQFVLSMDYSIILMNRYRMEKNTEVDSEKAMSAAIRKASSSILSSSFTTIVGLLALVFMKFKIGMDLGIVLAKGVFFSLLSIYTILPALILMAEKAIKASEKKVPLIPTGRLAGFEVKFRWGLAGLFVLVFAGSFILQNRTELSYASIWETEISKQFAPQTSYLLLYRTSEEESLIPLCDSISKDKNVVSAISYPSLMKRKYTAEEMFERFGTLSAMLPAGTSLPIDSSLLSLDNIKLLYYAAAHPVRDEKMSFEQIINLAQEASDKGLIPEGMDINAMMAKYTMPVEKQPAKKAPEIETQSEVVPEVADTTILAVSDSSQTVLAEDTGSRFTYENCNTPMSAMQLSNFLGSGQGNTKIIFRMAGHKGGTMSPVAFIEYVNKSILTNRLLRKAISDEQLEALSVASAQIDSVIKAGPPAGLDIAEVSTVNASRDSISTSATANEPLQSETDSSPAEEEVVESDESTPMDRLAEMAISGRKYSAARISRALSDAGIKIDRNDINLMFLYHGSKTQFKSGTRLSIDELVDFLTGRFLNDKTFSKFINDDAKASLGSLREMIDGTLGTLRGDRWSAAAIVTDYPVESDSTFTFVETLKSESKADLTLPHYIIGEPVMYKEMKDGFRQELIFLTLLTIAAIFLIVALTFKSLVIPTILIMAVMSGVFINVYVSGIGGEKMLYLAYLIVQSILMGATIDYAILFTNFYLDSRRSGSDILESVRLSYRCSIHTIMTSGMIMVFAPYVMALALPDPTISSILSSLTMGALSAILVILFLLPAMLAACDRIIVRAQ